jgi:hypothetical protein
MIDLMLAPLRVLGWTISALFRLGLVVVLLAGIALAGFVLVKGSQPLGAVSSGPDGQTMDLGETSYWEFMAGSLAASRQTLLNCHRTRLAYLAIALPLYPVAYTFVALYPESTLARHVQPSRLIPDPITPRNERSGQAWRQVPETWWRLVVEVSLLAFTQLQWDFTPAVGERVKVDQRCVLPVFTTNEDI